VRWVLERREFCRAELAPTIPERQSARLDDLLRKIGRHAPTETA
jgi:hypothetical protein